ELANDPATELRGRRRRPIPARGDATDGGVPLRRPEPAADLREGAARGRAMTLAILTPALQERIVASLRAGGLPETAARGGGIEPRRFRRWMRRGDRGIEPYRSFAAAVREAGAQARLRAEMDIFENQPRIWLQHGPGRETHASPGWTTA